MTDLFTPLKLGKTSLPNRILMAPLTRCRADANHVPTAMMAEYYAQRASAGLLIAEATMVSEGNSAFWREPGIYSAAQISAWRTVTDAVHAKGGRIFLQIWHGGRACHPALNDGATPVAPSAIAIDDTVHTPEGKLPYVVPRALELSEIPAIVTAFRQAALNAIEAGFDGVEIHGANGYLLDQFLRSGSNQRSDHYGGPLENRARLLFEVIAAVTAAIGPDRTGLRLSPLNSFNSMLDDDPIQLMQYLATELNRYELAYLHLMRADFAGIQQADVISVTREHYQGTLIGNMGYSVDEASSAVASGQLDAIAFGSAYIANPDLVERFAKQLPLAEPDAATFYTQDTKGYTDYPSLA
ncbi:alkene reductase [Alkalimonas amylolytica]|uniref:N-ethylmaleimide reductase n=1 Tax=Alkalimonas amylolytica TaxID=152573 RepID=A0A1H4BQA8_ALKAM|nr:alkene reductase [Alkalimonas amylolytica]SEA50288.1 N-ethylmaleimide reductase [Alkalimonas amylolytica]